MGILSDFFVREFAAVITEWAEGPWVCSFPTALRDALAEADKVDIARYAARWADTEQLALMGHETSGLASVLSGLADLARLARSRQETLYTVDGRVTALPEL